MTSSKVLILIILSIYRQAQCSSHLRGGSRNALGLEESLGIFSTSTKQSPTDTENNIIEDEEEDYYYSDVLHESLAGAELVVEFGDFIAPEEESDEESSSNGIDETILDSRENPPQTVGCFSGSTLVHRRQKSEAVGNNTEWVSLDLLEIGDVIEVAKDTFEPIYAFGHINPDEEGSYMELNFDQVQEPLQITKEHLIWTPNKGAVPAGSLKVGEYVVLAGGRATTVTAMQMKTSKGVYAPFTLSGTLVLNHGLMASSYISLTTFTNGIPLIPSAYHHALAHLFTFPHRFMCHYQSTCPNPTYNEVGVNVLEVQLLLWIQRTAAVVVLLLSLFGVNRRWQPSKKI